MRFFLSFLSFFFFVSFLYRFIKFVVENKCLFVESSINCMFKLGITCELNTLAVLCESL